MTAIADIVLEKDLPVPLRDGTITRADVYRPVGARCPVLLARQSYSKGLPLTLATAFSDADPYRIARRGYAVVIQDGRGAPSVGGEFRPFLQEIDDGYDSVEWCAAQPWSTGNVGMVGRSYLGTTPWLAAMARPPSLKAIATGITAADVYAWAYQDGALGFGFLLTWAIATAKPHLDWLLRTDPDGPSIRDRFERAANDLKGSFDHLPLKTFDGLRRLSPPVPYYDWLEHPDYDDYWERTNIRPHYPRIGVASLNMGGWYDIFIRGTIDNFVGMASQGTTDAARSSRMVIGPWGHDNPYRHYLGHLDHGPGADPRAIDLDGMQLRFFDLWLKGIDDGWSSEPPVRIFVMGENVWRNEAEWPLQRTEWTPWFLHSRGFANTLHGDGTLAREEPGAEPPDRFVYDPGDPVPTWGGASRIHGIAPKGPVDQRGIETRSDVLVYTSAPLDRDMEVTGPVRAVLHLATTAPDTDVTAKLCDVHPDGRAIVLCDGIVRARYRLDLRRATPVVPGEVVRYEVELGPTSDLFRRGHRIRLEVSSSNFPRFDRNLNTGGPFGEERAWRRAYQTLVHDAQHPSHLMLPVVPR